MTDQNINNEPKIEKDQEFTEKSSDYTIKNKEINELSHSEKSVLSENATPQYSSTHQNVEQTKKATASRENYYSDMKAYRSAKRKLLILKFFLIFCIIATVSLLFYMTLSLAIIYDNKKYIDDFNILLKKERFSQALNDENNKLFLIDFRDNKKELSEVVRSSRIDLLYNEAIQNKSYTETEAEDVMKSLDNHFENKSTQLSALPRLNNDRKQFMNSNPNVIAKIGYYLGMRNLRKEYDILFMRLFHFNKNIPFNSYQLFFFQCLGKNFKLLRIYKHNDTIQSNVLSVNNMLIAKDMLGVLFSELSQ